MKAPVAAAHPLDAIFRSDRFPHLFCPGCGLGIAMRCLAQSLLDSGRPLTEHVVVSGIGCTARIPGYLNVDSYHTTHGRSIPFATGLAMSRPDLEVTVIAGDGDLFAIGGNHFIHAARRNVNLTVICVNNFNYGMTGGQVGPTTPTGAKGTTAPKGNLERPFSLPHLAAAAGATFVSRWTVLHARQLKGAIQAALTVNGFAFIEALSPCPIGFGRPNDIGDGLEEMELYRERCVVNHGEDLAKVGIDLRSSDRPIVLGNFLPAAPRAAVTNGAGAHACP